MPSKSQQLAQVLTSGPGSVSGFSANSVIYANTSGYLANTANLTYDGTTFSTVNPVNIPNTFGYKNRVVNGSFDVWQRGTTFNSVSNTVYTADRWWVVTDAVGTVNITQVDIASQGLNSIYALRAERSSGTNRWVVGTNLETAVTKALYGKTITFSCKLRKGSTLTSDISVAIGTQNQEARFGTLVDNGSFTISNASVNTSTFTQFSKTFNIPSNSTGTGFKIEFSVSQAGSSGAYFEIAEVQVEVGNSATAFDYRDYGRELQMCQRFFQKYTNMILGSWGNNNYIYQSFIYAVPMRTAPTWNYSNIGYASSSSLGTNSSLSNQVRINIVITAGGGYGYSTFDMETSGAEL